MRNILRKANKRLTIGWAAALLSGMSLISMCLSLFRERLLNANFGVDSLELDAYRAAFKVPDFMFIVLVSGALSVTFIPVLTERLSNGNKKSAWDLSSSLLNLLAAVTLIASVVIMIFADVLVEHVLAPGMSEQGKELAVVMMRIIAINPFLFAVSSVLTSVQQAVGRFFFFALAPAIYSAGIIIGITTLAPRFGILGVAYGVVIGSVLQLLVAVVGMIGLGFSYHNGINWKNQGLRDVLKLLPQRSLDQGIDYFNNLVEISLASHLKQGSINRWEVAFTLHWVPINLIGVAISTAAFPQMAERLSQGRPDLFKKEFLTILRVIVWLALPVIMIAYLGRGYIVRLLVANGDEEIALLLGSLVLAIFFRILYHFISRSFYAQKDTKTPLKVSIIAIGLNIALAYLFVSKSGLNYGLGGLALAQSLVATIEVIILMVIMSRRFKGIFTKKFFSSVLNMTAAAGLSSFVMYILITQFPLQADDVGFFSLVPKFIFICMVSVLSYVGFSYMFGINESKYVVKRVRKTLFKPVKIQ